MLVCPNERMRSTPQRCHRVVQGAQRLIAWLGILCPNCSHCSGMWTGDNDGSFSTLEQLLQSHAKEQVGELHICVTDVLFAVLVIGERLVVIGLVFKLTVLWSIEECRAVDMYNSDIFLVCRRIVGFVCRLEQRQ
jgi:hypothetical protein